MENQNLPAVSAIIVAAGASRRMGFDKLSFRLPDGRTVLETSCAALAAHPAVTQLVLVCGGNRAACEAIAAACPKPCAVVQGGATRADSVRNGLAAATGELVAIHDAARPFISAEVITAALTAAAASGAAAPAVFTSKATEAAAALAVLGYSTQEVQMALKGVDVENLPLEEIIRQGLKKMVK